ncbi:sigma 54-interacting transcriptional regulator [Sulfurospirillum arcachonense]|uniref:sigma 54-interacting transcriptional regulator n=1 Tax=Sulfurospirillum arcachonense TaxID=57666 RepID=UPI001FE213A9|nr:Fis family transcriptional regulator [Sulfurospirillum arcachonense]
MSVVVVNITKKMVVDVVDHTSYIAKSRASLEALKSANLLKSLNLSALILGESGTGKQTLAKFILPEANIVDADGDIQELLAFIDISDTLIIKNFDKINNYPKVKSAIELNNTRVIATSKVELSEKVSDDFFSLKITLSPLSQREEDILPLAQKFFEEVSGFFGNENSNDISLKDLNFDLSNNCYSLRKSVYLKYLVNSLSEEGVMDVMEEFLLKKLGGRNDYREQLYLFDVPMLRSGFKKFHSQLNMSEKFGLNRNTLRKKINDYKDKYKLN